MLEPESIRYTDLVNTLQELSPRERSALTGFLEALRRKFTDRVLDLRLFGSALGGVRSGDSDLDVAVIVGGEDFGLRCDILDLASDVFLRTQVAIDATILSQERYRSMLERERRLALDISQGVPL